MKRKIVVLLMAIVMLAAYMPMMASPVSAYSTSDFTGKDCVKDSYAASTIDYIMAHYPAFSKWKGGGECWGYAEKLCDMLGASTSTKYYTGKKLNKKNVKELIVGVKAGTHVRMGRDSKTFDAGHGHSIVIFKCTEKEVIWADNNRSGDNIVDYHRDSFDEFLGLNYDYIHMVRKVTKYNKYYTPMLESKNVNGDTKLMWTKTPGAKKYNIYRSGSEYGTYKKIGTTTKYNYSDSKAPLGKKVYYKVKAVKSSGNMTSNIESGKRKLKPVKGLGTSTQENTGKIKLSWKNVSGATSYTIYRYSFNTYKWKKIKSTTATSYVDSGASSPGEAYYYQVKAYSSKAKISSEASEISGIRGIARPTDVKITLSDWNGNKYPDITWKKVKGASSYNVYRSEKKTGPYEYRDNISDTEYIDSYYYEIEPGKTYYYKIQTVAGNWWSTVKSSLTSAKSIKIPPLPEPEPEPDDDSDDDSDDEF